MKEAIWIRVGPATGILFVIVLHVGFLIHGYPDIRPSDSQLAIWLANVDVNRFRTGISASQIKLARASMSGWRRRSTRSTRRPTT
jgi:hypothetical protein